MKNISPRTWRAKLLSGKYLRSIETLKGLHAEQDPERPGFCCLGVYADVIGIPLDDIEGDPDDADRAYPSVGWHHERGELAESELPWWMSNTNMRTLINLNDEVETGPGWGSKGGVIDYIDRYIIPKYDKKKKAQK